MAEIPSSIALAKLGSVIESPEAEIPSKVVSISSSTFSPPFPIAEA